MIEINVVPSKYVVYVPNDYSKKHFNGCHYDESNHDDKVILYIHPRFMFDDQDTGFQR